MPYRLGTFAPCCMPDRSATIPPLVWARRGARVVESTCLESMRLSNGTVGSNPTLSAIQS
jgi:hypothetical protein